LFDREYSFKGRHATYVKNLVDSSSLFNRHIDVYILAPIVGFLNGRIGEVDKGDVTAKIFTDVLIKEQTKLKFIYRLIMLLDDRLIELSTEQKLERAFKEEDNEDNSKIFESYVLGGVEYLYEMLFVEKYQPDEFINSLFEFVDNFNDDLLSNHSTEELEDILKNYN
jgi:hypothetical protein